MMTIDAYEAAYEEILEGARSGKLTDFIEERGCEILDRIAAIMFLPQTLPDEHMYAKIGMELMGAIDIAMTAWAQDEAHGKHTRDRK